MKINSLKIHIAWMLLAAFGLCGNVFAMAPVADEDLAEVKAASGVGINLHTRINIGTTGTEFDGLLIEDEDGDSIRFDNTFMMDADGTGDTKFSQSISLTTRSETINGLTAPMFRIRLEPEVALSGSIINYESLSVLMRQIRLSDGSKTFVAGGFRIAHFRQGGTNLDLFARQGGTTGLGMRLAMTRGWINYVRLDPVVYDTGARYLRLENIYLTEFPGGPNTDPSLGAGAFQIGGGFSGDPNNAYPAAALDVVQQSDAPGYDGTDLCLRLFMPIRGTLRIKKVRVPGSGHPGSSPGDYGSVCVDLISGVGTPFGKVTMWTPVPVGSADVPGGDTWNGGCGTGFQNPIVRGTITPF